MARKHPTRKIGEMLLAAGLIDEGQLQAALELQRADGAKLGSALVRLGSIEEPVLATFLGMQRGVEAVELGDRRIPKSVLGLISAETAYRWGAIPVRKVQGKLEVVLVDPGDRKAKAALEREAGLAIRPAIAPQSSIYAALKRFYPEGDVANEPRRAPDLDRIRKDLARVKRILAAIERELG